jgi:uncharacterized protein (DUF305 family)
MNSLSLVEKRRLLVLAEKLKSATEKRNRAAQQANNLLRNSQISVLEMVCPSTNKSRNIVRRIGELDQAINHHDDTVRVHARKLLRNYPFAANSSANRIISNVANSIKRMQRARSVANQWHFVTGLGRVKRRNLTRQ